MAQAPKDPSEMTDEELDKALEEVDVPEPDAPPKADPPEEEKPKDEPEEEPEEEPVEEPEEEEEKPPSRRETLRVQAILAKLREDKEPTPPKAAPDALDYDKAIDADPELIAKLKADRDASNRSFFDQGREQAKSIQFHTRLEIDAPRVDVNYPQLDKNSDKFHSGLADAINTMYLSTVGYDSEADTVRNPSLRYIDYVDSIFELASEIAGEQTAATRTNIGKQAAKTGLRPDGSSTKKLNLNKAPQDMTDEELDAYLAAALPK